MAAWDRCNAAPGTLGDLIRGRTGRSVRFANHAIAAHRLEDSCCRRGFAAAVESIFIAFPGLSLWHLRCRVRSRLSICLICLFIDSPGLVPLASALPRQISTVHLSHVAVHLSHLSLFWKSLMRAHLGDYENAQRRLSVRG